jgi:predicted naringenin-chalcone synthase
MLGLEPARMTLAVRHPRILTVASAFPRFHYTQETVLEYGLERILGADWRTHEEMAGDAHLIERLFKASRVEERQSVVDLHAYYAATPTTGERMSTYQVASYQLGREALEKALRRVGPVRQAGGGYAPEDISDFVVVSCTGYSAPGLDIQLARDLNMRRNLRRLIVGHMGCFGSMVGLRHCLATCRAHPDATAAMLSVELAALHFVPSLDPEALTEFALFGDAAAATLLTLDPEATGPEIVDMYCAADYSAADQMSWRITDQGFAMTLSPRVPVTLRRNILEVMDHLLTPNGLTLSDISHWVIHPGGPSILDAIQGRLDLTDEHMAPSRRVLRAHGNCSSVSVLLILEEVLRSAQVRAGEWGVMMAFGPGLTLETALLRF